MNAPPRKLIEVALPLEAINRESAREKSIRHGHPSTLHLWWARRPLAACRAVLFAQLVDDPSAHPDRFPTEEAQDVERQRLFAIIEDLVKWENINDEKILEAARAEIRACYDGHPPPVLDPFAGGGSIPLEAQRLGLEAHASDLNPVAVLINKALIEIPPRFAGQPPIHPEATRRTHWTGAQGLAEDVRRYGAWMRDEAQRRIGHLYPPATLSDGTTAPVIAWIWARTVTCPNPACRSTMPLVNVYALSRRTGREAWLEPRADARERAVLFRVRTGPGCPEGGTVARTGATCLVCGAGVPLAYIRSEGKAGRLSQQLTAVVAEGHRQRAYLASSEQQAQAADVAIPADTPDTELPKQALGFRVQGYGITHHADLFTPRQLTALCAFSDLVADTHQRLIADGAAPAYASSIATYLSLVLDRLANRLSSQCFWDAGGEGVMQVFARNALPMVWVFAEANPFSDSSGNFNGQVDYLANALDRVPASGPATVIQADATTASAYTAAVICTDPPYYDNVPYADLSDFFYVWLRRCAAPYHPDLFATMLVPKGQELIAEPARQGSRDMAAKFFEDGLRVAFSRMLSNQTPGSPFTLFYAFKQAEMAAHHDGSEQRTSTGWETMLQGLLDAGATVTGTWPVRTEQPGGLREVGRNALASSVVLVCRPRLASARTADRRGFLNALHGELPKALRDMQKGNIAPVDLAQAAIGPGMAVFSGFARVIESDGAHMTVRSALGLINQVLDEVLAEQEGEFDAETRWAIKWFEQSGFDEGPYGTAEVLAKATGTALRAMQQSGILRARSNRVRLLGRADLPADWDPATDLRTPVWETTMHLARVHQDHGDGGAGDLLRRVGAQGDVARDLAYRLYSLCEKKHWAAEALVFNSLVTSWPEIAARAAEPAPAESPITDAGVQGRIVE